MPTRRVVIPLLAAALIFQGMAAAVPHQHGPIHCDGAAVERPGSLTAPHHCLACSIQAPVAAPPAGIALSALPTSSTPAVLGSPLPEVATAVESTGPRGPPRVF